MVPFVMVNVCPPLEWWAVLSAGLDWGQGLNRLWAAGSANCSAFGGGWHGISVGSETSSLHRVGPPQVVTIGAAAAAEGSGASAHSRWGVQFLCSASMLPWLI